MKAIILAAGMGTRMGKYTENLPKGMLQFAGKPIIEHQINCLRQGGVKDIVIVRGYKPEKITFENVRYYENPQFDCTNMVATLFCAEEEMNEDFLICYADILYEPHVLKSALEAPCEIGVTVDTDFRDYWNARLEDPQNDNESFVVENGKVIRIGEENPNPQDMHGRYVGLIKCTGNGRKKLQKIYHDNEERCKNAYMTDILQMLINAGVKVKPIPIERGWLEFDTAQDYEQYQKWQQEHSLNRFFHFS